MSVDNLTDICPFHPPPSNEGSNHESDDRLDEVSSLLVEPPHSPLSSPQLSSEEDLSSWYQTSITSSFDSLPDLINNDEDSDSSSIPVGLTSSVPDTPIHDSLDPLLSSAVLPEGRRNTISIVSPLQPFALTADYHDQGVSVHLSRRVVASRFFERLAADNPPTILVTPLFRPFGRANVHTRFAVRSVSSFRGGNGDLRTFWDDVVEDMAARTAALLGQSMEAVFHRRA